MDFLSDAKKLNIVTEKEAKAAKAMVSSLNDTRLEGLGKSFNNNPLLTIITTNKEGTVNTAAFKIKEAKKEAKVTKKCSNKSTIIIKISISY